MPKFYGDSSSTRTCENVLYGRIEILKCTHIWKVKKFSRCTKKTGDAIVSPTFFSGPHNELQWNLVMYPNGKCEEYEEYVSLFLALLPGGIPDMNIKLQLSILSDDLVKVGTRSGSREFSHEEDICPWKKAHCGWEAFIRRDYLFCNKTELLRFDELSILCETCVECPPLDFTNRNLDPYRILPQMQSYANAGIFLDNEKYSDVILRADNKNFKAHRAMLAANSSVFASMLESDIQRNQTIIELVNLKSEIVCELLHFMYTGQIKSMDAKVLESLLGASEKYMIGGLKSLCEQKLITGLSVSSVPLILDLADRYKAGHLKKHCFNFIRLHAPEVVASKSWKLTSQKRPHLVVEAFNILAQDSKKEDHVYTSSHITNDE